MKTFITSAVTQWWSSKHRSRYLLLKEQFKTKVFQQQHTAEVYLSLNDPYSFMLIQVLPALAERFEMKFKVYMVLGLNIEMMANNKLWQKLSFIDANVLAEQYMLMPFTNKPESKHINTGQQEWQLTEKTLENALAIFKKVWGGLYTEFYSISTPVINAQLNNQYRQKIKGHYLPATILFAGDWYWGVDRLNHFEEKLNRLGLSKEKKKVIYCKNHLTLNGQHLCEQRSTITAYLSLRSPYSYLGFSQVKRLAEHYQVNLDIQLVMPMVMRGLSVPNKKQKYIYLDAVREARVRNIAFDKFSDPIGEGINCTYSLFGYAKHCGLEIEYLTALFQAVYVKGIDLSQAKQLQLICQKIGLDYHQAKAFTSQESWQQEMSKNAKNLEQAGFWGVPVFIYQDIQCWGQDRLWQIEKALIATSNH